MSAFGGIVAVNREVDLATAQVLAETFLECIVAPSFAPDALALLRGKKNLRLLATGAWLPADHAELTWKRIGGGLVVQDRDATAAGEVENARVVTRRAPTDAERRALAFAWRVCKHVKSNAIVLAQGDRTVGVGAGQMSRVESVKIAVGKAGAARRGERPRVGRVLPLPRRPGAGRAARRERGRAARRQREGRRADRSPPIAPAWPWSSPACAISATERPGHHERAFS